MKQMTSAAANKLIRSLQEEKDFLIQQEDMSCTYVLADGEKAQPPAYDYEVTQAKIDAIDAKIVKIKHGLNLFNTRTVLKGLDMTIDEALVEMAQLNRKKYRLDALRKHQPVFRRGTSRNNVIEYEYVNYDLEKAAADYQVVSDRIIEIQMALDLCNQTETFEVELD